MLEITYLIVWAAKIFVLKDKLSRPLFNPILCYLHNFAITSIELDEDFAFV